MLLMEKKRSNSFLLKQVKELQKQINEAATADLIEFALAPKQSGSVHKSSKWVKEESWTKADRRKLLESLDFDPYECEDHKLLILGYDMFESLGLIQEFNIPKKLLRNFLRTLQRSYRFVPFHNFFHAFNVAQTMYFFLVGCGAKEKFSSIEVLALLVSAFCHDVDHPGLNNAFLCATRTSLAAKYNDFSVLEQHHCSSAFQILNDPNNNIFIHLTPDQYSTVRKLIIACILSTDLAMHGEYMGKLKGRIEGLNWENAEDKKLMMCCLVKCADISNEIRTTKVGQAWAGRVMTEFYAQSSLERAKGLPVSPHMDPEKTNTATGQIGFITFLCMPLFVEMTKVFPSFQICVDHMVENREAWTGVEAEYKAKQADAMKQKEEQDKELTGEKERPPTKESGQE